MRLKMTVLLLFLTWLFTSALPAGAQEQDTVIKLDTKGGRGGVNFNHSRHEALTNPDPSFVYKAKRNAACAGCHHTQSSRGIPQLWKCTSCHKGEGHEKNPKNRDYDEVHAKRAFHDLCIGCHRVNREQGLSVNAPVSCGGCHNLGK